MEPLYRIIYRDGYVGDPQTWDLVLYFIRAWAKLSGNKQRGPYRVERI